MRQGVYLVAGTLVFLLIYIVRDVASVPGGDGNFLQDTLEIGLAEVNVFAVAVVGPLEYPDHQGTVNIVEVVVFGEYSRVFVQSPGEEVI